MQPVRLVFNFGLFLARSGYHTVCLFLSVLCQENPPVCQGGGGQVDSSSCHSFLLIFSPTHQQLPLPCVCPPLFPLSLSSAFLTFPNLVFLLPASYSFSCLLSNEVCSLSSSFFYFGYVMIMLAYRFSSFGMQIGR